MQERRGLFIDIINIDEYINEKYSRLLRGGSFAGPPAVVRSANRIRHAPAVRSTDGGFRPARTDN
jgi:formylglycine-generating enzyme required for sulfatase activity